MVLTHVIFREKERMTPAVAEKPGGLCKTCLHVDFGPLAPRTVTQKLLLCKAAQSVVICYGPSGKLIQPLSGF